MALTCRQYEKMKKFQDDHFTAEEIEELEHGVDKEYRGVTYYWIYWLHGKEYRQVLDLKTGEIELFPKREQPKEPKTIHLSAYVRDKTVGNTLVIARDYYTTKKKFAADLRDNGYTVIRISNNRDLAAQDVGYETFAKMKKLSHIINAERIAEIEKIEL